ncbi:hypothetical protein [Streptomyces griseoloalbus]|uniref:Uncharacterized protein n=1 Tax=Streptomyces griseoloalbus TaxID=67303 RepID=A0A7W8F7W0_9ACTN|nr:hypothetical protein [Streptomyces albaduncus]MBB5123721.1 hypothetical protein [Streptomyces albaduncus]GGV57515.1 hypothetical protein GCM10010294_04260 [Streptomyces griseoloalbus]GGW40898.1 hypothetical protein GCM10010340_18580 [Streptomyces albaduncus]
MPASIHEEVDHLLGAVSTPRTSTHLSRPSLGFEHAAQVFGHNDGISYVCTARGRSRS